MMTESVTRVPTRWTFPTATSVVGSAMISMLVFIALTTVVAPAAQAQAPTRADEVVPLPATSSDDQHPLPFEEQPVSESPPVFEQGRSQASQQKSSTSSSTNSDEWLGGYADDGSVSESQGAWPVELVIAAQVAAGFGIGLVFAPAALALIAASTVLLPDPVYEGLGNTGVVVVAASGGVGLLALAAPGAIAATQTLVGDWIGSQRGALVWPLLAAYIAAGATWMTTALSISAVVGAAKDASRRGERVQIIPAVLGAFLVPAVAGLALTAIAPIGAYYLGSDAKRLGDDGRGLPGLLRPAHAAIHPAVEHPLRAPVVVSRGHQPTVVRF